MSRAAEMTREQHHDKAVRYLHEAEGIHLFIENHNQHPEILRYYETEFNRAVALANLHFQAAGYR